MICDRVDILVEATRREWNRERARGRERNNLYGNDMKRMINERNDRFMKALGSSIGLDGPSLETKDSQSIFRTGKDSMFK
jgi:hypothetical protein